MPFVLIHCDRPKNMS